MPETLFIAECLKANGKPYKKRRFMCIKDAGTIGFCSHNCALDWIRTWCEKKPGRKRAFRIVPFVEIPDGEEST